MPRSRDPKTYPDAFNDLLYVLKVDPTFVFRLEIESIADGKRHSLNFNSFKGATIKTIDNPDDERTIALLGTATKVVREDGKLYWTVFNTEHDPENVRMREALDKAMEEHERSSPAAIAHRKAQRAAMTQEERRKDWRENYARRLTLAEYEAGKTV